MLGQDFKTAQTKALVVLSPAHAKNYTPQELLSLIAHSFARMDFAIDPRDKNLTKTGHFIRSGEPDINRLGISFSETIRNTNIDSDFRDLSVLAEKPLLRPDYFSLQRVAKLFTGDKCAPNKLGCIFFAALHAKTPSKKDLYDEVYITLTPREYESLPNILANNIERVNDLFMRVNLNGIREAMKKIHEARPTLTEPIPRLVIVDPPSPTYH